MAPRLRENYLENPHCHLPSTVWQFIYISKVEEGATRIDGGAKNEYTEGDCILKGSFNAQVK